MIVNAVLIIQNISLKNVLEKGKIDNSNTLIVREVPEFFLYDGDGVEYNSFEMFNSSKCKVFIFFSVSDCASCLLSRDLLRRISMRQELKVYGIVGHPYKNELKKWIKNENLPFPILCDFNEKVTKSFGVYETPMIVLADEMNRIIFSSSLTKNPNHTHMVLDEIDKYI
jgi:peroxiredoxin